ncbi:MAG: hypothetical protein V7711_10250 [Pseudomonadales bacterium]
MQIIKAVVYFFLLINFALYIQDDWVIASHTMRNGGSFIEWTRAFATSIDESAWFILLILFEMETYVLSDEPLSWPKALLMHGLRVVCYVSLAHTLYAYGIYVYELSAVVPIADVTSLCQLLGKDVSYALNLVYTELSADNCASLSTASQFYYIDPPEFLIVNDAAGLVIERQLAWLDVLEASVWLIILFTIEAVVQLQDRKIGGGALIRFLNVAKFLLYSLLWCAIAYWIYRGHWMFAWDEFVWIAGFVVIEMNVVEWRSEINQEDALKAL